MLQRFVCPTVLAVFLAGSPCAQELTVQLYDVRALVEELPRAMLTGPGTALGEDMVLAGAIPEGGYRRTLLLTSRLKEDVTPDAWTEEGRAVLALDGVLVVRHDARGHAAVGAYLEELRRQAGAGMRVRIALSEVSFPGGAQLRSLGEVATAVTPGRTGVGWSGDSISFMQGRMGALASNFAPRLLGQSRRGLAAQVTSAPTDGGTVLSLHVAWAGGPRPGEFAVGAEGVELPTQDVFEWSGMLRVPSSPGELQAIVGLPLGPRAADRGYVLRVEVAPAHRGEDAPSAEQGSSFDVGDLLMPRHHAAADQAGGVFQIGFESGIDAQDLIESALLVCDPAQADGVALVGSRLMLRGQPEQARQAVAELLGRLRGLYCRGAQLDVAVQRRGTQESMGFAARVLLGMRASMRSGRRVAYVAERGPTGEPIQESLYLGGQLDALVTATGEGEYVLQLGLRWAELAAEGLRPAGEPGGGIALPAVDRAALALSAGCREGEWQQIGALTLAGVIYDVSARIRGGSP